MMTHRQSRCTSSSPTAHGTLGVVGGWRGLSASAQHASPKPSHAPRSAALPATVPHLRPPPPPSPLPLRPPPMPPTQCHCWSAPGTTYVCLRTQGGPHSHGEPGARPVELSRVMLPSHSRSSPLPHTPCTPRLRTEDEHRLASPAPERFVTRTGPSRRAPRYGVVAVAAAAAPLGRHDPVPDCPLLRPRLYLQGGWARWGRLATRAAKPGSAPLLRPPLPVPTIPPPHHHPQPRLPQWPSAAGACGAPPRRTARSSMCGACPAAAPCRAPWAPCGTHESHLAIGALDI
jgi:hypothetical protein